MVSLLLKVVRVAAVDLLYVPVQLSATLTEALPDWADGVLQVLIHMGSVPPGAGIHHGPPAGALWQPQEHLHAPRSDALC